MILELPMPHINQRAILESLARFRVVMCGRRFGKSELSQIEIITAALRGQQVAYITPTYALATVFFDKLTLAVPFKANRSELYIEFPNGGRLDFFTGERLNNLRGRKFHLVVVDEAAYIPNLQDGWENSIRPTLTDYKGRAIFLSTPRGHNFFYTLYSNGLLGNEDWQSFKFTSYENPYIDPAEIDDARAHLPETAFAQEYLADPAENAANPFGTQYIRQCIYPISSEPPVVYGIDLAKSVDWTVITGLDQFGGVCYFSRFQKPWRDTMQAIRALPGAGRVWMLVDSTGVGDPVTEDLQNTLQRVEGYKYSQNTKQDLMLGLQLAIQRREITYPEGPIPAELEAFEYKYTPSGVRYSAPPGFTDDCVNSLALARWQWVKRGRSGKRYAFS
jgi:hypothetical protein